MLTARNCLLLLMVLFATNFAAASESYKSFEYTGQLSELVELENQRMETRYREQEVPSTCTRQVPYETEECGNVTRYRTECRTVPGRRVCRDVPHQRCRWETRYRRVCRQEPPRNVCRTRRVCTGVGRARVCQDRRECRREPGRRVCHQEPHRERICRTEYRRECRQEPDRRECREVPYQDYQCRTVTRYRDEQYSCTRTERTPYEVIAERFEGALDFNFMDSVTNAPIRFDVSLSDRGEFNISARENSEVSRNLVIANESPLRRESEGELTRLQKNVNIKIADRMTLLSPVTGPIDSINLEKESVSFRIGTVYDFSSFNLYVRINRGDDVYLNKTLSRDDYEIIDVNGRSEIFVDLGKMGIQLKERNLFGRYKYEVKVETSVNISGEILNADKPRTRNTRVFEKVKID